MSKNKKKKISQKELERRKKQAKMWHIATHPNEEYENAEKKRRDRCYLQLWSYSQSGECTIRESEKAGKRV